MEHKKLTLWITLGLFAALAAAGGAFAYGGSPELYKGTQSLSQRQSEPKYSKNLLRGADFSASVLGAQAAGKRQPAKPQKNDFPLELPPERAKGTAIQQNQATQPAAQSQTAAAPSPRVKQEAVSSPCGPAQIPVYKNLKFSGCRGRENPAPAALQKASFTAPGATQTANLSAPGAESAAPKTCESEGLFTYTGPDQPGLLYGMCINQ